MKISSKIGLSGKNYWEQEILYFNLFKLVDAFQAPITPLQSVIF